MPLLSEAEEAELQNRMAHDPDAREPTDAELARMRPARDVLPTALFAALTRRGRPKSGNKRVQVTLRIDPAVLEAYKSDGPGWQTRMNTILAQGVKRAGAREDRTAEAETGATSRDVTLTGRLPSGELLEVRIHGDPDVTGGKPSTLKTA